MKKFSSIAKIKALSEEPEFKVEEGAEYLQLRTIIEALIDEFLHLRIEGPINPILQGTILIDGKPEFVNALIEAFCLIDSKKELKLLESAKSRFILSDTKWIDNKIASTEEKIYEYQSATQISKHEQAIKDIFKAAKGDLGKAKEIAENKAKKLKDGKKAFYRAMAAEKLSSKGNRNAMLAIAGIYMNKVRELGYTPQSNYFDKSTKKL